MRRCRIVLQARTSSRRLPAKVLLPIAGLPLALLCACRLASSGRELVLATSRDPSDDILAALAEDQGIKVYRGSLDNVAERFLMACADMNDDDLLVRATADNPVPDGSLVEAMLDDFPRTNGDYLGPGSYRRELPIGLGVEIVRLGAFRHSLLGEIVPEVAEHVTPHLSRAGSSLDAPAFDRQGDLRPVRMTVDTLNDYLVAARAFRAHPAGAATPWRTAAMAFMELRNAAEGNSG